MGFNPLHQNVYSGFITNGDMRPVNGYTRMRTTVTHDYEGDKIIDHAFRPPQVAYRLTDPVTKADQVAEMLEPFNSMLNTTFNCCTQILYDMTKRPQRKGGLICGGFNVGLLSDVSKGYAIVVSQKGTTIRLNTKSKD